MQKERLILYCSSSGRTEKVAIAISKGLKAEVRRVQNFNLKEFREANIVGFGSGIYYGEHNKKLINLADKLPTGKKKVFVFSTSGCGTTRFHKKLCKILNSKGYNIVDEIAIRGFIIYGIFQLVGGINRGKPNEKDLKEAEEFGTRIRKGNYLKG